jgi:phosphoribosylamine--glycine ligase
MVAGTVDEGFRAVDATLVERRFGAAGGEIVVEDFLTGVETSFHVLVDGKDTLPLATAQDYKRVGDGDTGPNTGGMGGPSPSPHFTPALEGTVMERIILPAVAAMQREGRPLKGVLYAGLMLTEAGPKLLEFNTRFGDPECQVLMMRLMSDPLPALVAAHDGVLKSFDLRWHADSALCVVMAARGYPDEPQRGSEIRGLDAASGDPSVKVFHAGTRREGERVLADGGRVLGITALGSDIAAARDRAYTAIDRIDWPQGFYRHDIGQRALGS